MVSDALGWHMPAVVTLDDLTALMDADEYHRYEVSPKGVVSIMPPPEFAHAVIATQLMLWLGAGGLPAKRLVQAIGLRIPDGSGRVGGRIPDLVVWSKVPANGVWLPVTDVLLVIEIISPGSEGMDLVTKRGEYAAAGIPQYWTVDQDSAETVTMHRLDGDHYAAQASMPLAWVLSTAPADHDLV